MNEGPAAGGDGFEDDGFGEEDETFGNDPMVSTPFMISSIYLSVQIVMHCMY
jgi:hypothetical protein